MQLGSLLILLAAAAVISSPSPARKRGQSMPSAISPETKRLALNTVVDQFNFSQRTYGHLSIVNKHLNEAVAQKPISKYLLTKAPFKECLERLFYGPNHALPPTEQNPVKYLFIFRQSRLETIMNPFDSMLEKDVYCLERLLEDVIPVEITTCADPVMKNSVANCSSFEESPGRWDIHLTYLQKVTTYNGPQNVSFAKRLLLSTAIRYQQEALIEYLLNESQDTPVSKEHIAVSLYVGNEELFERLIQPLVASNSLTRQSLTFDGWQQSQNSPDFFSFAIRGKDPSKRMMDRLSSLFPLHQKYFSEAAKWGRTNALKYLNEKAKRELPGLQRNRIMIETLKHAASACAPSMITYILDEITDLEAIAAHEKELIVRNAITSEYFGFGEFGQVCETCNILSETLDLKIQPAHIVYAIEHEVPLKTIMWLIDQCEWTVQDIHGFLKHKFLTYHNQFYLKEIRDAVRHYLN